MEVFHGRGDVRSCDEVFTLFDAELRDIRVEGNGEQADHNIRLTDQVFDNGLVCYIDEHRTCVLMFTGQILCFGQRVAGCEAFMNTVSVTFQMITYQQ